MSSWELKAIRAGSLLQGRTKAWLRDSIISAAAAAGSPREGCGDCLVYYTAFLLVTTSVILSAQPTKLFPANSVKWEKERERQKDKLYQVGARGDLFLSVGVGFASPSGTWGNSRTAFNPETHAFY